MKRPSYRDAVFWIANNDDTDWIDDALGGHLSVTAALVVDMFDVREERFRRDLRREIEKRRRSAEGG